MNGGHIATDFCNGLVQFRLPAARNEDVGSLFDKALGGSKADTAAAPVMTAIFPCNAGMICSLFSIRSVRTSGPSVSDVRCAGMVA